jgi:hypothetical protein
MPLRSLAMSGPPKGKAYRARTGAFDPDKSVRAAAVLHPDEEAHRAFRWLLEHMDVSAAEVVRQALIALYRTKQGTPSTHQEAA